MVKTMARFVLTRVLYYLSLSFFSNSMLLFVNQCLIIVLEIEYCYIKLLMLLF